MSEPSARRVACPACRQTTAYSAANPWRPFCSERCRNHDLGDWANERFRLPADAPADAPTGTAADGHAGHQPPQRQGH